MGKVAVRTIGFPRRAAVFLLSRCIEIDLISFFVTIRNTGKPSYSQKSEVIQKCHIEAQKGRRIILLTPAFTETKWFAEMKAKSEWLLFIHGRLTFNEHKNGDTAKFSSVLAFFNIEKREIPDLGWIV